MNNGLGAVEFGKCMEKLDRLRLLHSDPFSVALENIMIQMHRSQEKSVVTVFIALPSHFRTVRAMNEALKQERFRSKEQEPDASTSDGHMPNSSQGSRVVCTSYSIS